VPKPAPATLYCQLRPGSPVACMRLLRPLSPGLSRVLTPLILSAWVLQMGALLWAAYREARGANLATDLARYQEP